MDDEVSSDSVTALHHDDRPPLPANPGADGRTMEPKAGDTAEGTFWGVHNPASLLSPSGLKKNGRGVANGPESSPEIEDADDNSLKSFLRPKRCPIDAFDSSKKDATGSVFTLSLLQFRAVFPVFKIHVHSLVPCLHFVRIQMCTAINYDGWMREEALGWVIAGTASWHLYQTKYSQRQSDMRTAQVTLLTHSTAWLSKARAMVDTSKLAVKDPLDTLQSLVFLIYHAYISASIVDVWDLLGKACRFINVIGWDRLDASGPRKHAASYQTEGNPTFQ